MLIKDKRLTYEIGYHILSKRVIVKLSELYPCSLDYLVGKTKEYLYNTSKMTKINALCSLEKDIIFNHVSFCNNRLVFIKGFDVYIN